jgi:hypothetical protein
MVLKTSLIYQIGSNFYKSSNQSKPSHDVLHAEDMYCTIQVIDGPEETIVLLRGTVARDFRPLVFLINRPHIGSRFTP